jgi:hypothetical protein
MQPDEATPDLPDLAGAPFGGGDEATEALRNGPIGAFVVAGVAVGLLFVGWLAFYFLLFLPRGEIG